MSLLGKMDNFGANLSSGGNLTLKGNIYAKNISSYPDTSNIYYVNLGVTSSGNGLTWPTAFKTIAEAITVTNARIDWSASPWARNDVIVIAPGTYAENLTSMPYGAVMMGIGHDLRDAQIGCKIKPASGSPVNVGAAINTKFANIGFEAADTSACFDAEVLNNCMFENCWFSGPAETYTTAAGIVTLDAVMNRIYDCIFSCLDKGIDVNYADGGDSFSHNHIKDSVFDQIDTAGIEISTNLVGPSSKVLNCNFFGGGTTMATAIDDNSAILDVAWCAAEATDGYAGVRSVNVSYLNGALVTTPS